MLVLSGGRANWADLAACCHRKEEIPAPLPRLTHTSYSLPRASNVAHQTLPQSTQEKTPQLSMPPPLSLSLVPPGQHAEETPEAIQEAAEPVSGKEQDCATLKKQDLLLPPSALLTSPLVILYQQSSFISKSAEKGTRYQLKKVYLHHGAERA